jgi:membrane-bound lytic murein transglycosylase B
MGEFVEVRGKALAAGGPRPEVSPGAGRAGAMPGFAGDKIAAGAAVAALRGPSARAAGGFLSAVALAVVALLILTGCPAKVERGRTVKPGLRTEQGTATVTGPGLSGVGEPWGKLAGSLVRQGLPEDKVRAFFRSPGLTFSDRQMVAKLKELFPIFFRSDLTKLVQERLFQLGYDIRIDGRNGSGTAKVIRRFQSDKGLSESGRVSESLARDLERALITGKKRDLSEYKPPAAGPPDRTSTHANFTNPTAIATIRNHYQADKAIFDRMEKAVGVPGQLVASIMWIETGYGNYFGKAKAAASLASMAACSDYSLVAGQLTEYDRDSESHQYLVDTALKRGAWARDELAALLTFAWQNGHDPMEFPGSLYGAVGYGQFMPSNIARYAIDGDGDQRIDLFTKTDAIFSIGNFLKQHGWQGAMPDENKRREVIRKYNNSGVYINTVLYVKDHI